MEDLAGYHEANYMVTSLPHLGGHNLALASVSRL